ncbi:exodeoxyribonuclease VII small subunit [Companilactobacillus kedongensis]|uniref:exodeoxyribonuclease VII small subunit n=1 Tax=Companilactobacillus kedongensis TaxID=2486004 RepID=UPI000F77068A|nr:exodeoxyribonuclease VII small subunit [Companilactobacillus kedongensis]
MAEEKKSFEDNLKDLEDIVTNLENGNVPLEEAMENFKKGISLSKKLEKTLGDAETTVTKIMQKDGSESTLEDKDNEGNE